MVSSGIIFCNTKLAVFQKETIPSKSIQVRISGILWLRPFSDCPARYSGLGKPELSVPCDHFKK